MHSDENASFSRIRTQFNTLIILQGVYLVGNAVREKFIIKSFVLKNGAFYSNKIKRQ